MAWRASSQSCLSAAAVDLDDAFVHAVAESAGLGDFGDVGGDEPGFVAVA